jgi:hypothetical protein
VVNAGGAPDFFGTTTNLAARATRDRGATWCSPTRRPMTRACGVLAGVPHDEERFAAMLKGLHGP